MHITVKADLCSAVLTFAILYCTEIKVTCRSRHEKKPANDVFTGFGFKQITGVEERG